MKYKKLRKSGKGLSLVETLIAIGLLGVVLIPMLFLSSAYFLSQLTRTREGLDATHGASTFLNRFFEEAALSQRILAGTGSGTGKSDSDAVYLAYYEPITQKSYRVGYRLMDITGGRKLERLEYNMTTLNWDVVSPYGHIKPSEVILPSTAQFQYCSDTTCSSPLTGANVQNALFLRLHDTAGTGWTFTKGRQTFRLQQNTAVVLSTLIPVGQVILSDQPKEMYAIDLTQSLGASPTETLVNLNPVGEMFNYLTSSGGGGGSGTLSTLLPASVSSPGSNGVAVDSTGRVLFGQNATGHIYTWKNNVLSTVTASTVVKPCHTIKVASDDRFWCGQDTTTSGDGFPYSWLGSTGLSTIFSGWVNGIGVYGIALGSDGRVTFGSQDAADNVYSWKTGSTTQVTPSVAINYGRESTVLNPVTNGVYFGNADSNSGFRYWDPTTGVLSTIVPMDGNSRQVGTGSTVVTSTGRVYFAERRQTSGKFFTWMPSTNVLSTIIGSAGYVGAYYSSAVEPLSERVYFGGGYTASGAGNQHGMFWTYLPGAGGGTLSTILNLGTSYDVATESTPQVFTDGRVVFCAWDMTAGAGHVYSWKGTTLSTITPSTINYPCARGGLVSDSTNNRVFFGQNHSSSNLWVWDATTDVLSTLLPSNVAMATGNNYSMAVGSDGRLFAGSSGSNQVWTWKNNVLSTILPTAVSTAASSSSSYNPAIITYGNPSRVFFGSSASSNFWTWYAAGASYSMTRYTNTGINTFQTLPISSSGSHTYTLNFQDLSGDLYLLDTSNNKLDRYIYSASTQQYAYVSSLNITSSSDNGALAVDQSSTGASFLDTANDRIEVFDYRTNTGGTGTPDHSYALGSLSTVPTNPTGLAINQRTGDYLILDSSVQSSGASAYVRLFVVNSSVNSIRQIIPIKVNDTQYLSTDLRSETNFKIQYDERKNILYLTAPSADKTYALSLPVYL